MVAKFKAGDWVVRNGKLIERPCGGTTGLMGDYIKSSDGGYVFAPKRDIYWVTQEGRKYPDSSGLILRRIGSVFSSGSCFYSEGIEPLFDYATPEEIAAEIERCDQVIARQEAMNLSPDRHLDGYKAAREAFLEKAASHAE